MLPYSTVEPVGEGYYTDATPRPDKEKSGEASPRGRKLLPSPPKFFPVMNKDKAKGKDKDKDKKGDKSKPLGSPKGDKSKPLPAGAPASRNSPPKKPGANPAGSPRSRLQDLARPKKGSPAPASGALRKSDDTSASADPKGIRDKKDKKEKKEDKKEKKNL